MKGIDCLPIESYKGREIYLPIDLDDNEDFFCERYFSPLYFECYPNHHNDLRHPELHARQYTKLTVTGMIGIEIMELNPELKLETEKYYHVLEITYLKIGCLD
ncbi:MAG: hypothetical protein KAI43_05320 [Candidatus Aureabacteria bacterium]|nr:hypothetical protein [Candidatus Auribacterota bacterium]